MTERQPQKKPVCSPIQLSPARHPEQWQIRPTPEAYAQVQQVLNSAKHMEVSAHFIRK